MAMLIKNLTIIHFFFLFFHGYRRSNYSVYISDKICFFLDTSQQFGNGKLLSSKYFYHCDHQSSLSTQKYTKSQMKALPHTRPQIDTSADIPLTAIRVATGRIFLQFMELKGTSRPVCVADSDLQTDFNHFLNLASLRKMINQSSTRSNSVHK